MRVIDEMRDARTEASYSCNHRATVPIARAPFNPLPDSFLSGDRATVAGGAPVKTAGGSHDVRRPASNGPAPGAGAPALPGAGGPWRRYTRWVAAGAPVGSAQQYQGSER